MKVKFFSTTVNNYNKIAAYPNGLTLENEVNNWLQENPDIKVINIKQSIGGSSFWSIAKVFISVWYENENT